MNLRTKDGGERVEFGNSLPITMEDDPCLFARDDAFRFVDFVRAVGVVAVIGAIVLFAVGGWYV